MKKTLLTAALGLLPAGALAGETYRITYAAPGRGGRTAAVRTVLTIDGEQCRIGREIDTALMLKQHPDWLKRQTESNMPQVNQVQYIDYGTGKYYSVAELPQNQVIATEERFVLDSALVI